MDMTTMTIMRKLPREVNPMIYKMSHEMDAGDVSFTEIGGLDKQLKELREVLLVMLVLPLFTCLIGQIVQVVELPLINPEAFLKIGIEPPKGCLLYGPPGTGKTLLARWVLLYLLQLDSCLLGYFRAIASQLKCNFLKMVASQLVEKYIGESARMVREIFGYARDNEPCIIFIDEIDAIGE